MSGVSSINTRAIPQLIEKIDQMEAQTQTSQTGVTLYDRATGRPYCVYVENGQTKTSSGICGK